MKIKCVKDTDHSERNKCDTLHNHRFEWTGVTATIIGVEDANILETRFRDSAQRSADQR